MAYTAITVEGGLFPSDLLDTIATGDVVGQRVADFGMNNQRLSDEIQRAFSDMRSYWDAFTRRLVNSRESRTRLTRESWIIPLLEDLGYTLTYRAEGARIGGQNYVISHRAGEDDNAPPVHVVAEDQLLDRRAGSSRSPHGLVQEYLNRSDALWGVVTNGRQLRLLRDSERLARPTYLEFDLAGMVEQNLYSEFVLLYRLIHRSRLANDGKNPNECLLETYYQQGLEEGGRVREHLRDGVQRALEELGMGFLAHPQSEALRQALRSGQLDEAGYYRQLLRLVYRLLFLMVVEERKLLFEAGTGWRESQEETSIEGIDAARNQGMPNARRAGRRPSGYPGTATTGTMDVARRQRIYSQHYSVTRLRARCERPFSQDRYSDLWDGLRQTFLVFREDDQARQLGLSALNGELFGPFACPDLESASCENARLLQAMYGLSVFLDEKKVRRRVNYAGLDVEELGSVYESLLAYQPRVTLNPLAQSSVVAAPSGGQPNQPSDGVFDRQITPVGQATFSLIPGSERKQTGSYYTPRDLVHELIQSALVPVMEDRLKGASSIEEKEQALLGLTICDPASGSGHFLLAAARRVARQLAIIRSGEAEPDPTTYRTALRDTIRQCIYAVDKNPLAIDLCKVALWIEGYSAGLPLSFLDHHIKQGDSLVGVFDLEVLAEGIPDQAYSPVTGDDKGTASAIKRRNKEERAGQGTLFASVELPDTTELAKHFRELGLAEERTPYQVDQKDRAYQKLRGAGTHWWRNKVACDLWTAAFFWRLRENSDPPTTSTVRLFLANERNVHGQQVGQAEELSIENTFFHWPLEFPDVFARGGFDVVLGNPPWERIKLQEEEFFAARDTAIALAPNKAARERLIKTLPERNPTLAQGFGTAKHDAEAASLFIRGGGRFPLCGRGDVNTYSIFAELNRRLLAPAGRAGLIVPSGIATDDTTKFFFADLMAKRSLASLYDFENARGIFPGVHRSYKFCLLTMTAASGVRGGAEFAFFLHAAEQLRQPERRFALTDEDMALLNPNTRTCPIFRSQRDAEITKGIYSRVPVLIREGEPEENPWGIRFLRMFDMSNDSHLFRTREHLESEGWRLEGNNFERNGNRYLPLYEAKMIHQFDHRWATYDGDDCRDLMSTEKANPYCVALPRYWVPEREVEARLHGRWEHPWLLGWRDICRSTDERTVIAGLAPRVGVGNNLPLSLLSECHARKAPFLAANASSFVLDFAARFKVGGTHLNFFITNQLPILPPSAYDNPTPWARHETLSEWIAPRVLALTYTAWDMQPFARDLGYHGPPFPWDEERRFLLCCELDAAFFHLYGIARQDVDYIMETFTVFKKNDTKRHGEYRTQRVILEIYDAMARATETGLAYDGLTANPATVVSA